MFTFCRTVALSSRAVPSWPASLKPTATRTFRPSRPRERSAMSELALKLSPEESLQVDEFGELRQRARRALMQHGFPDLKTEGWKYKIGRASCRAGVEAVGV